MKRLILSLLIAPVIAHAVTIPAPGPYDARVRVVPYNRLDIVNVKTYYGVATDVQFGDGETVIDRGISLGDPMAWEIATSGNRNMVFIRPKAQRADTNATIITNKRVYRFMLEVEPLPIRKTDSWKAESLTFALVFTYPDEENAKKTREDRAAKVRQKLDDVSSKIAAAKGDIKNNDYWVAGSQAISPTKAEDDGRFIYLTFSNNRDMPAVYEVDEFGEEALINTNVEGNVIVVQRMVRQLKLRKGNYVACIVNKSFDPEGGLDNSSGTVAPDVQRIIKGAQ